MQIFSFLAAPLGMIMRWLYMLLQNYGWTIILFTILMRVLMFPLTIKQQKSTARMAAFNPMIQEVQKKWANDKNRQNAEMQKLYEEYDIKMTAGCLPTFVNIFVIFGMIAVIQAPLTYILDMPQEQITNGVKIVQQYNPELGIEKSAYSQQSMLIGEMRSTETRSNFLKEWEIKDKDGKVEKVSVEQKWIEKVDNFNFKFLGMDLSRIPIKVPRNELPLYIIFPILSLLGMFGSQFVMAKTSGNPQQMKGSMMIMTVVMGIWFGYIGFTISVGFSLYYTVSNIVMTIQQLIVKKIYDPEKIKLEINAEIEEKKKAKKAKKKVAIIQEDGDVIEKELSESELAKERLLRARKLDEERYGLISDSSSNDKNNLDKAQKDDEEKYSDKSEENNENDIKKEDKTEDNDDLNNETNEYKPGRRKRNSDSKRKSEQ